METSGSMTQNSPMRVPGPMEAAGETRAVGATTAEGSMGMNPYDKPIGAKAREVDGADVRSAMIVACEFANWRNGWALLLKAMASGT
jgi:hypothetical protein